MSGPLKLPLHLPASRTPDHDSLQHRIFQIHSQKGDFRNVTEALLINDIRSQKREDDDSKVADIGGSETDEPENGYQMIIKGREDMMQQLRRAQNDTLMALDFISLLLSKFAPTTAQSTMSPALRDAVPIGTLEARIMKYRPPTTSESRSAESVSRAYKLHGFSNAADKILGAASRLEEEAVKEEQYWEQILSIKQKGWSISRVPRDPRGLGVHFGFRDAAPSFRKRGFAALKRDVNGGLRLDRGAVPSRPVAVQVSVLRRGHNCGASSIPQAKASIEDRIDRQILQARNTLYEEELFHELGREARSLANQGASMSSKRVKMPLDEQTQMHFDLIDLNDDDPSNVSGPDQQLAEGIAIALRILLSHAHEQNLRRRSQPPPPMTLKPRPTPEYALIRPIITHHQHRRNIKPLTTFLQTIIHPFSLAGVPCRLLIETHVLNHPSSSSSSSTSSFSPNPTNTPTHLLETLTQPATTTITLTLPTQKPLKINIHTNVNPPVFGTEYSFSPLTLTYPPTHVTLPRLTTLAELEQTLRHILTVDLVELIIAETGTGPEGTTSSPNAPSRTSDKNAALAGVLDMGMDNERTQQQLQQQWTALDRHQGSLCRGNQKLIVRVWDDRLGLRYLAGPRAADVTAYVWGGGADGEMDIGDVRGKRKVELRRLIDVVRSVGR